jgi:YhcH/YjgK/YiaL family protein
MKNIFVMKEIDKNNMPYSTFINLYFRKKEPVMIFDDINVINKYKSLHPRFEKAFEFILSADINNLTVGKHQIDGENIYASVNEYTTKAEGYLEAHKKYIDIQIVAKGTEKIGFARLNDQVVKDAYNGEKDITFYYGDCEYVKLEPGTFAIFFPEDLHKPGISVDQPVEVKKIVIKVRI